MRPATWKFIWNSTAKRCLCWRCRMVLRLHRGGKLRQEPYRGCERHQSGVEWTERNRGNAAPPFTAASCEVTHSHIPLPLPCLLHDGLHPASNASQNKPCLMLLVRHFITMRKVTKTLWEHKTVSEIIVETHINQTPRDDYLSPRNTSKHFSMHNNIIYHTKTYKTKKIIKQNNHFAGNMYGPFPLTFRHSLYQRKARAGRET